MLQPAEISLIWFHWLVFLDPVNLEVPTPVYRHDDSSCET